MPTTTAHGRSNDNRAMEAYLEHVRTLAEAAGAASLAEVLKEKERFRGKRVVVVLTQGNASLDRLRELLAP